MRADKVCPGVVSITCLPVKVDATDILTINQLFNLPERELSTFKPSLLRKALGLVD